VIVCMTHVFLTLPAGERERSENENQLRIGPVSR
jgi:hypothetical protein